MAKAVEDKVAAVIKFVTDFQGMVPTWYILEGGFETFQGTRTVGTLAGRAPVLGGRATVRHLEMQNRGTWG